MRGAIPFLACAAAAALAVAAPAGADEPDFGGIWESTFGLLEMVQDGDRVSGVYASVATLEGTVDGGRLTFRYVEPEATGEGWFELRDGGRRFAGEWRADGEQAWAEWQGTRLLRPQPSDGFEGVFETTYGPMRLWRDGDAVRGRYGYEGGSTIEGTVADGTLTFTYAEPRARGEGGFELLPGGEGFRGQWREEGGEEWRVWEGRRVEPRLGVLWLVVMEAPWETTLATQPYSFGEMLRAYFARFPHVRVRQTTILDRDDFVRTADELAYLAEPVALVLAGHGEAEGLLAGGEVITAADITAALADAPGVFLTHFSACAVMGGEVPGQILGGLPEGRAMALSGYAVPVDWAASAVLEFLYLELVLGRRMPPAEAAAVIRAELGFAGDQPTAGSPLGAAQFRFQER